MTLPPYRVSFMAKTIVVDGITYRFNIWDTTSDEGVCLVSAAYWNNICVCTRVCSSHACAFYSAVSNIIAIVLQKGSATIVVYDITSAVSCTLCRVSMLFLH